MLNSLIVAVAGTLGILVASTMAAYAMARFHFRGRRLLYQTIIVMLLVPIQAYVVPLYLMAGKMDLLNTLQGLILPSVANVTSIFILHAFFKGLPMELEEAARIDGAGEFRIFWQIMLPLTRPALATISIFLFLQNWNEFLFALTFITDNAMRTLPTGIYVLISSEFYGNYGLLAAALVLFSLPVLVLYFIFQQQFIEGLTAGALKH
jgi:multiple sugar transport system permease protein